MNVLGLLDHLVDYGWVYVALIMLLLSAWDAGYFRRGRHRGEYVEKSEWKHPLVRLWDQNFNQIIWNGHITPPSTTVNPSVASMVLTPSGGLSNFPALAPVPEDDYGRFGDLDIDRADAASLRPTVPVGLG